jgi:hypothetical protein
MKIEFLNNCLRCETDGQACVLHRDRPWFGLRACHCRLAGAPCPSCNSVADDVLPTMSGFNATEISNEPIVLQR